ncbi:MAG: hopanoid-associated sugar epimerase [Alphaproteobacteria bacterium]
MTTLITGASGFVGSAVLRRLLAEGHRVRVLVRAGSDRRNLAGLDVELAVGDLNHPETLRDAVARAKAVFHVAADYRLWVPRPEEIYRANVEGTGALLRAAAKAGVERVVYTSSVATLGLLPDGAPADELTPSALVNMIGHYKRSKFLAEEEARKVAAETGLPIVIVNPSTPIGPRDVKPTPTGRMVAQAAAGKIPAFLDTGLNVVHVDDVAEGHLLAFARGKPGERYILGGENMSLSQILTEIAALVGRRAPRIRLRHGMVMPVAYIAESWARAARRGEPMVTRDGVRMARKWMYFSSAKAERELGYTHRPAVEALRDAVAWFKANGYCP